MSRRVLARPFAAATLSAALVLVTPLAVADPGNGNGGGQESAPGQQEDKETEKETGKESAPGQQKDKGDQGQSDDAQAQAQGEQDDKETGKESAPGQQKDKGPQGPKPGKGPQGGGNAGGNGQGGGTPGDQAEGDPAGNNGTVKIAALDDLDSIPNNTPHPGCTFQIEWYGFDEGEDVISTVSFAAHAPTSDVVIGGTSPSEVFVGGDPASGAGTETGLDGRQAYTLTFDGEPHPKQGYHVKLTVSTPYSLGNDTKSKVFWVAPCEEETTTDGDVDGTTDDECTGDMPDGTEGECVTEGTEECTEDMPGGVDGSEVECVVDGTEDADAGVDNSDDQGVQGTQLAAVTTPVQNLAGLLTNADSAGDTAAVPTSVDAGADGPVAALTDSPWPLLALAAGLLAGLGALVVRRRAGA